MISPSLDARSASPRPSVQTAFPHGSDKQGALSAPAAPSPRADATDRLSLRVDQALRASGYEQLREIRIQATGGTVVLEGVVPRYYLKQLAQCVAMALPEVSAVRNELLVTHCG